MSRTFRASCELAATAEEAFAWHSREGALERLMPPWEAVRVVRRTGSIVDAGSRVELRGRVGPIPFRWIAEHGAAVAGREFRDRQVSGPFACWEHVHRLEPLGSARCVLEDRVEYQLRGGSLGRLLAERFVRRQLERMFRYRHTTTASDLALHRSGPMKPWKIAIGGSSGLVGSALVPLLTTGGHRVIRLVRGGGGDRPDTIDWDPDSGRLDPASLEGVDAVIHLGGENIASGRWTEQKRERIRDSRVRSTRLLADTIARLERPPQTFACASGIHYYGSRGGERLSEEASPGQGFLSGVCRDWEEATAPASEANVRVVNLRFAMVLSPRGGALAKMLTPFRLGLGGRVGDGEQIWSWVGIDDVAGAIHHCLADEGLSGPVNVAAPQAVSNREFTATLARVLRRPAVLPVPATALRIGLGSMADELLLASIHAVPKRLVDSGYAFRHADLESALRHVLGA